MLTKTMIALSTVLVLGAASAAFANEDPENMIGDRYPALEQAAKQSVPTATTTEFSAVRRHVKSLSAAEKAWLDRPTDHISDQ